MILMSLFSSRQVRAAAFVLALVVCFAGSSVAFAQQVVVRGNQRVEESTVKSYLNLTQGQAFDETRQNDAIKALFATGLFQDVNISSQGSTIIVTVVENPVVNRIAFEGNRKVDSATLTKEVESKPRGIFTRARVQADVQRIVDVYRRQGRFDATVEPKVIELERGRVDLVFEVNEGDKTKVERITFIGNHSFTTRRLRDIVTTTESNFLSFLKTSDVYDPDRVNVDQELLRRFYLKNGYADFRVVSAVADFDRDRNAFFITFTLDEGERYNFGVVEIESNVPQVDAATLRDFVRSKPGAVYNADLIDKSLEDLSVEISQRGFPFAQVRPRGDRDAKTRTVGVTYVIEDAPRLYVDRINIRGNTRTLDSVIRREFDLAEGDALNRVLVDRAERRLNQLGYFKSVKITREPGSDPDRVALNVNIEEQSTGEVSFGVGYATNDGILGDVSISERNFLGRGQFVKATVGAGQRTRNVDLSFTEPYFLDRRLSFGVDFFYRQNLISNTNAFNQQILGGGLRAGVQFSEELSGQARYRGFSQLIDIPLQFRNCTVPGRVSAADAIDANGTAACLNDGEATRAIISANGRVFVSQIGFTLAYNRLDQQKNPRNGIYAELGFDLAGIGGDVNYARFTGELRGYYNFYEDLVAYVKLQGGYISGWGNKPLRVIDTFFRGGDLVRGFQTSGLGPRDISNIRADSLGGTTYLGVTGEIQFPIPYLPDEFGLRGAFFADAGTLFGTGDLGAGNGYVRCLTRSFIGCNYFDDAYSVRASVGASLVWQSPLGPLRFDFALPLKRETYDRIQTFRFSGGSSF